MDIKNTLIGIFFLASGMLVIFMQSQDMQDADEATEQVQLESIEELVARDLGTVGEDSNYTESFKGAFRAAEDASSSLVANQSIGAEEKIYIIGNDFIEVSLTNKGGAIQQIRFLKTKRGALDDYIFNENSSVPALSLSFEKQGRLQPLSFDYAVADKTNDSIEFVYKSSENIKVTRRFSLNQSDAEPYLIQHETIIKNQGAEDLVFKNLYFNLGTTFPLSEKELPNYLTVGSFDGSDSKFTPINKLTSKGFLSNGSDERSDKTISRAGRYDWVSQQNQYFVGMLLPSERAREIQINSVYAEGQVGAGLSSNVAFAFDTVASNESRSLKTGFYVGPKEFKRLQALGESQDKVMQFGWFGFFSKLLLFVMTFIHGFVPNWGWSIVIMTILVKLIFWPLTGKAAESQKGMAKIQAPMAELKKKYEKNPQKMQQETMRLFKEHGVNPLAGCLPILIQMPIFLGLFYMLRTAAELRYESFLWVSDLSQADTVAVIAGFPINLLPLIMGITMYFQMQITPVSPTADPMQQKIFKFMPFIFLVFLYNFSSGLVVYWTTQNILTIIQTKMIHSKKDPIQVEDTSVQKARPVKAKVNNVRK
jgi:YidC/Oxa1 family membrane protein insertase